MIAFLLARHLVPTGSQGRGLQLRQATCTSAPLNHDEVLLHARACRFHGIGSRKSSRSREEQLTGNHLFVTCAKLGAFGSTPFFVNLTDCLRGRLEEECIPIPQVMCWRLGVRVGAERRSASSRQDLNVLGVGKSRLDTAAC